MCADDVIESGWCAECVPTLHPSPHSRSESRLDCVLETSQLTGQIRL